MSTVVEKQKPPSLVLVIHANDEDAGIVIDGRQYLIPPNEPFVVEEIACTDHMTGDYQYRTSPQEIAAEMVRLLWHVGMVQIPVNEVRTRNGITYKYDEASALKQSKELLVKAEEAMLQGYVTQCRELMSENKPAQPPGPRIAAIIKKYGIDLKAKYNISPVGFDVVSAGAAQNEAMEALREQMAKQQEIINQLLAMQSKKEK